MLAFEFEQACHLRTFYEDFLSLLNAFEVMCIIIVQNNCI